MGVAASMSMSVVVEDQLWGLILCHARRRHPVPSALRTACEQVAQFVSLQVESRGATAHLAVDLRAHQLRTLIVDQMTEPDPVLGLAAVPAAAGEPELSDTGVDLLDVLEADAAAARLRGRTVVCGDLVDAGTADRLVAALRERAGTDDAAAYVTSSLRLDVPAVADLLGPGSDVAGVLGAPRPDGAEDDYLVWFRREVEHTVNWAGEPTVKDQSGTLSPRASFALWREKVRDHSEPWQARDVEIATRLADAVDARLHRLQEMALAAAAVRAQELFQREHEIADALQRGMLPVLPEVDDLTLSAAYVTASESAEVGGDWYDVFTLPDGSTGIAMGDVTGHDLSAAAVMGQLRSILRSYAWEQSGPDKVLDKVDALVAGFAMQKLATVFFARLERPGQGVGDGGGGGGDGALLRYANAGHLPPVLRLPDGRVELLEDGRSVLIGVAADLGHEAAAQPVPAGSTLLLYTDGLVEQRDREISDGIDQLRAVVAAGPEDADALRDHVLSSMVPGRRDDDVAVLVVCVH
jgi:serine phosphatase RsbU (regulator of sigma subunit)